MWRRAGWLLLGGGAVAMAALVRFAGHPASMVGVPGAGVSNLSPPTLAAVTFGCAQCGAALLLAGPLRRAFARPAARAGVTLIKLSAMTIFLWHQTAMMVVTAAGPLANGLPVFAAAPAGCWAVFRRYEQYGRGGSRVVRRGPAVRKEGVHGA